MYWLPFNYKPHVREPAAPTALSLRQHSQLQHLLLLSILLHDSARLPPLAGVMLPPAAACDACAGIPKLDAAFWHNEQLSVCHVQLRDAPVDSREQGAPTSDCCSSERAPLVEVLWSSSCYLVGLSVGLQLRVVPCKHTQHTEAPEEACTRSR